jgi:hypothetical protein
VNKENILKVCDIPNLEALEEILLFCQIPDFDKA